MEERLLAASLVPMEMMEKALKLLDILEFLGEKGSRMAVSDVGVAVKNREKARELNEKARDMIAAGTKKADDIYGRVLEQLAGTT